MRTDKHSVMKNDMMKSKKKSIRLTGQKAKPRKMSQNSYKAACGCVASCELFIVYAAATWGEEIDRRHTTKNFFLPMLLHVFIMRMI